MERPLERRAATRTAVVWDSCRRRLDAGAPGQTVVDIGGGTGGFAVRVAELGHRVTVVDPSPDALAALDRRARERHVDDLVTGIQGDLAGVNDLVQPGSADLVLCHGVLGLVDDPADALAVIARVLRPGGALSLLVAQRHADHDEHRAQRSARAPGQVRCDRRAASDGAGDRTDDRRDDEGGDDTGDDRREDPDHGAPHSLTGSSPDVRSG